LPNVSQRWISGCERLIVKWLDVLLLVYGQARKIFYPWPDVPLGLVEKKAGFDFLKHTILEHVELTDFVF
jgi:hypothetical protein